MRIVLTPSGKPTLPILEGKTKLRSGRHAPLICTGLAIVFLLIALVSAWNELPVYLRLHETNGTVSGSEARTVTHKKKGQNGQRSKEVTKTVYNRVIQFNLPSGVEHRFEDRSRGYSEPPATGTNVAVLFDPQNPTNAEVKGPLAFIAYTACFSILAVLCAVIALVSKKLGTVYYSETRLNNAKWGWFYKE